MCKDTGPSFEDCAAMNLTRHLTALALGFFVLTFVAEPSRFEVMPGGVANNISFFFNVVFHAPGRYWVQTLIDSTLSDEQPLTLFAIDSQGMPRLDDASEAVN